MVRAFAALLALTVFFAPARALASCPLPSSEGSNDASQFFRAVTLADRQAQLGTYDFLAAAKAPSSTPFDVVYAIRSNLSRLECATSLVAPFTQSTDTNISDTSKVIMLSLQGMHQVAQRMLDRVNGSLSDKGPSEVDMINNSAADSLKLRDYIKNVAMATTMSAMLIRACDKKSASCNRLLLDSAQRKDLTNEWIAIANPQHTDAIADIGRLIVKMLKSQDFKSSTPASLRDVSR